MKEPRRFKLNENPTSTNFIKNLNALVDAVNKANNLSFNVIGGTGSIKHGTKGHSISLNIPPKAVASSSSSSEIGQVYWATITEDATSDDNIKADIHSITTGARPITNTFDSGNNTSEDGGTKTGLPCAAHGFYDNESITITETDDGHNGAWAVDATSTEDKIIIAKSFVSASLTDGVVTSTQGTIDADIYAEILNGSRLDMCVPRLSEDDVVPIVQRNYDDGGTPILSWWFTLPFMCSEDYWELD